MNRIEIRQVQHEELVGSELHPFPPSRDQAWIIGVLASGGYSNPSDKKISVDSENEEFLRAFRTVGERVFNINGSFRTKKGENNARKLKGVSFQSKRIVEAMGDLRSSEWHFTIINQHQWIIENQDYLWSFIEGVFERKGGVIIDKERVRRISIGTDYVNSANFLAEILVRLGIDDPHIEYSAKGKDGVKGVNIYDKKNLKYFAENVHSVAIDKEEKLEACRQIALERKNRRVENPAKSPKVIAEEDIVNEWIRLKTLLGHVPNSTEIKTFRKENKTEYSVSVYNRRFGEGGFSKAKEKLEEIVSTREFIEQVRNRAAEFYNTHKRLSRKILRRLKNWSLLSEIDNYPGKIRQLKVDLGLELPSILDVSPQQIKYTPQEIEEEALKIYQSEGRLTQDVLESLGRHDLIWAIRYHYKGRYKSLRSNIGIPEITTKQGVERKNSGYWTIENIEKEAREFYRKEGRLSHKSLKRAKRQDLLWGAIKHYPGGLTALKDKICVIDGNSSTQEIQIFP